MPQRTALPETVVGIDVETTSLDPAAGEIIEVSAIKYHLGEEVQIAEFTRLCRPRAPLAAQITAITGITNEMVGQSPAFADLRDELQEFIGESLLFAHNASFDIGFLTYHGLKIEVNPVWDTFMLASVAWPEAESYNLGLLAAQLGIVVAGEHRAGDDVRLTWQLLEKIREQLATSPETHQHITEVLVKSSQEQYLALFTTTPATPTTPSIPLTTSPGLAAARPPSPHPPAGGGRGAGGEVEVEKIFSATGPLAKAIPGYTSRPEQLAMAQEVERLIKNEKIGLIEAGTGIGKTYAYLIPLLQSVATSRPAVVATYTKNLQDQLMQQDVPRLLSTLELPYTVACLKGRRNYLCTSRLKQVLQRKSLNHGDAWLLIKILIWLEQSGGPAMNRAPQGSGLWGDLERLNISHQGDHLVRHLHADALLCRTVCGDECPYHQARQAAQQADLVIINHALLAQLAASQESILPLQHLAIDEAHHLADVFREASGVDLTEHRLSEILAGTPERKQLLLAYRRLVSTLTAVLSQHQVVELRLTPRVRQHPLWAKVQEAWASMPPVESNLPKDTAREVAKFMQELQRFIAGSADRIQWLERRERGAEGEVELHDVALDIQGALRTIFTTARSVTLTSATLTTRGNFNYIKRNIGIKEAEEKTLSSSLNYQKNMLIYIIDDGPQPKAPQFEAYVARNIQKLALELSGRLLGLFTSHQSLRNAYFNTINELNKEQINLLAQKVTGGRHNIASRFKKNPRSVLLGTYSFWEGIDVPGESLSCVVIPRLPFPPPHDPIPEAIAEATGVSQFEAIAVPQTILKLRQGIGRLLRSSTDRGVVVILDRRLIDADWAAGILASLPPATIKIGAEADLAPALFDWFGAEKLQAWRNTPGA